MANSKAPAKAPAKKTTKTPARRTTAARKPAAKADASTRQTRRREGGVPEERAEIKVSPEHQLAHNELSINFSGLAPETDFEVKISGPIPNWYSTLKSDPWGQAQIIWRSGAGGDYKVEAKGPGISVSGEFSIAAYDADAEYRAQKRARRSKGKAKKGETKTGSVPSVEEPGVMGDTPSREQKAQPTEEELNDPEKTDPEFKPAEHDPDDQGDPAINKTPPQGAVEAADAARKEK